VGCQAGAAEGTYENRSHLIREKSKLQSNEVRELPKLDGTYPNCPKWFRRPCQVSTFFWHDQAQARFVLQIQGVSINSFLSAPLQGPKIDQR